MYYWLKLSDRKIPLKNPPRSIVTIYIGNEKVFSDIPTSTIGGYLAQPNNDNRTDDYDGPTGLV